MSRADRSPGNSPLATFGESGIAVLPEFSITVRNVRDSHVVSLHGELDVASADGLFNSLVELAGSTLVVDLSDLAFMDSSGIGAIVRARSRIKTKELGDLVLTRPGAIVRRTLEIVGLDAWIVDWSREWDA
jgi:anti-sigma B factor antagonist